VARPEFQSIANSTSEATFKRRSSIIKAPRLLLIDVVSLLLALPVANHPSILAKSFPEQRINASKQKVLIVEQSVIGKYAAERV